MSGRARVDAAVAAAKLGRARLKRAAVDLGGDAEARDALVAMVRASAPDLDEDDPSTCSAKRLLRWALDRSVAAQVTRTQVGFMGCHGTFNGLRVAHGFTRADPAAIVQPKVPCPVFR